MKAFSSRDFLDLWEQGRRLHPLDQVKLVLRTAIPETPYENLADWPLGWRNRALLEVQQLCFGPRVTGRTACQACKEKLEFEMDTRALVSQRQPLAANRNVSRLGRRDHKLWAYFASKSSK